MQAGFGIFGVQGLLMQLRQRQSNHFIGSVQSVTAVALLDTFLPFLSRMPLPPGMSALSAAMPGILTPAAISAYPFGLSGALGMPFTLPFPPRKPAESSETAASLANDDSVAADDDDNDSSVETVGGDDAKRD